MLFSVKYRLESDTGYFFFLPKLVKKRWFNIPYNSLKEKFSLVSSFPTLRSSATAAEGFKSFVQPRIRKMNKIV